MNTPQELLRYVYNGCSEKQRTRNEDSNIVRSVIAANRSVAGAKGVDYYFCFQTRKTGSEIVLISSSDGPQIMGLRGRGTKKIILIPQKIHE